MNKLKKHLKPNINKWNEYLEPTLLRIVGSIFIAFLFWYAIGLWTAVFSLIGAYLVFSVLSVLIFRREFNRDVAILIVITLIYVLFTFPKVAYTDNTTIAGATWSKSCECFGIKESPRLMCLDCPLERYCIGITYNCEEKGIKLP